MDRSNSRTPVEGEDATLVRIVEGMRSAAQTRARTATKTIPRRTPLARIVRSLHRERNTPISGFKHPGRRNGGRGPAPFLHQSATGYELGQKLAELLAEVVAVGAELDGRAEVVDLLPDVVADAFEDVAVDGLGLDQVADRVR